MKTLFKSHRLVLIPESDDELAALSVWKAAHRDFAFALADNSGSGAMLSALGPRMEACREPINVWSGSLEPQIRLIANFAATPFELDGVRYASVEAFWQSLRFPVAERARIAALDGACAKYEAESMPYGTHVVYDDTEIPVGSFRHWQLMKRACRAKFTQNADARTALLSTGARPLEHKVPHDSRTIPGVIMADIWMAIRAMLRKSQAAGATQQAAHS